MLNCYSPVYYIYINRALNEVLGRLLARPDRGNWRSAALSKGVMTADHAPFRSQASRELCLAWYERQLAALRAPHEVRQVASQTGGRTQVIVAGAATGEPLLMVHGAGGSAAGLRDEIDFYCEHGFRVFAPDIPGHSGRSEVRKLPWRGEALGRWLAEVISGLGFAQLSILGLSLGAYATFKLAGLAPEHIRRVVAIVPSGFASPSLWHNRGIVWARLLRAITGNPAWDLRLLAPMFAPGATPDPFVREGGLLILQHWQPEVQPLPLFRAAQLPRFVAPALILAGELDPFFPADPTIENARRAIPQVIAEKIPGAGHLFSRQNSEYVRARTVRFLREKI